MTNIYAFPEATPDRGRFAQVSVIAITDRRLSAQTHRVFTALASFANTERRCWPSQATIAAMLGVSRQAIGQHLMALRKLGYISWVRRVRKRGGWAGNYYTIHEPPLTKSIPHKEALQDLALQR